MSESKPWVKFEKIDNSYGKFTLSPLRPGMGTTIGNSLRRALLSTLSGSAVTSVLIDGVEHEFSTLPDVAEDVLDVINNIKGIVFRSFTDAPKKLVLNFKGKGKVLAKDITHDAEVEIVNPNHPIAELTKNAKLKIEMTLEKGMGYSPSEAHQNEEQDLNTIFIDASFSPIVRVNPVIEKVRVGKSLDYDKLILEVKTNGGIDSETAIREVTSALIEQFSLFANLNDRPAEEKVIKVKKGQKKKEIGLALAIEDLELSARS